jgi:hypothetical protein
VLPLVREQGAFPGGSLGKAKRAHLDEIFSDDGHGLALCPSYVYSRLGSEEKEKVLPLQPRNRLPQRVVQALNDK